MFDPNKNLAEFFKDIETALKTLDARIRILEQKLSIEPEEDKKLSKNQKEG